MASVPVMTAKASSRRVELMRSAPKDSWIALSNDESKLVAVGKTFAEADEAAKKTGEKDYFLTRTPDVWASRVFSIAR